MLAKINPPYSCHGSRTHVPRPYRESHGRLCSAAIFTKERTDTLPEDLQITYDPYHTGHTRLSAASKQLDDSTQDLQRELDQIWPIFSYPCGRSVGFDPKIASILCEEGFKLAVTLVRGHNVIGRANPFVMRPVSLNSGLSMAQFRLALTLAYELYGVMPNPEWYQVAEISG